MSHPVFTLLASVVLALAFAMVDNRTLRERLLAGARVFLGCAAATFGGGWLMYLIHG